MIKAVIFDWGGVLITNPWEGIIESAARQMDVSSQDVARAFYLSGVEFQSGTISEHEFWARAREKYGQIPAKADNIWYTAFKDAYLVQPRVWEYAKELRARDIKIGFLSNTERPAEKFFYEQKYDLFDAEVFSCSLGFVKPDRRIYEEAVNLLGVRPQEAVYTDDKLDYVQGAISARLHGILFNDLAQLKEEMKKLVGF